MKRILSKLCIVGLTSGINGCGSDPAFNTEVLSDSQGDSQHSQGDVILGEHPIGGSSISADGLWSEFCDDNEGECPYQLYADDFTQLEPTPKELDIVVIVDNSGSMQEEQVNLATKLSSLMQSIQHTNWQLALNSTDYRDRDNLRLFLSGQDQSMTQSEQQTLFHNTVHSLGTKGSGNEMGIFMAANTIEQSWMRPTSTIAVLIVSDEDNCSQGTGCTNIDPSYNSHMYLYDSIIAQSREPGKTAKVYSLHRRNSQECPQAPYVGHEYNAIVAATSGIAGAICDEDYSSVLEAMSADLAVTLDLAFSLSQNPVPGSVRIWINDVLQSSGYQVQLNKIIFHSSAVPNPGDKIHVKYLVEEN